MVQTLKMFNMRKAAFVTSKENKSDDIVMVKSDIINGYYINDKAVETKIDSFIYKDGKVLKKLYHNNRLCMITVSNYNCST